jgi:hypothetical protein
MADPFQRVRPGESLTIHATAWNKLVDMARPKSSLSADTSGSFSSPYVWVYAKNTTGGTINRWGVMAITGVQITPTTSSGGATAEFERMPVLTGAAITGNETKERCVAVEPIENNKVGRVAIAGAVQIKEADLSKLPNANVLWKDSNWALVRLAGNSLLRLGTVSATWNKGSNATVTQLKGDGSALSPTVTFTATNHFATVTVASGTKKVACGKVDETWILIAAEC